MVNFLIQAMKTEVIAATLPHQKKKGHLIPTGNKGQKH